MASNEVLERFNHIKLVLSKEGEINPMVQFWNKWLSSNKIEREDLIEKLPCFNNSGKTHLYAQKLTVTTFNSYIESLERVLKARNEA